MLGLAKRMDRRTSHCGKLAMRDGDQEFGVDRLEQAFARCAGHSATDTVNDILAAVDRFTQGAAQHDDITLVAIRKT